MGIEVLLSPTDEESVNTNSMQEQLRAALSRSKEYRHEFLGECIRSRLTSQIKALRDRESWDYKKFAEELGKKVPWAYRLEDPNESIPTIPTLLQVAKAFDVALDVRFVPFSQIVRDTTTLSQNSFQVPGFNAEAGDSHKSRAEHLLKKISVATEQGYQRAGYAESASQSAAEAGAGILRMPPALEANVIGSGPATPVPEENPAHAVAHHLMEYQRKPVDIAEWQNRQRRKRSTPQQLRLHPRRSSGRG